MPMHIEPVMSLGEPPEMHEEEDDLQSIVAGSIQEAVRHFEEHIEPDMSLATDYYFTRATDDLPNETGRSNVMSSDLRDATLDQIPDVIEIFMGSDSLVEVRPARDGGQELARQATEVLNFLVYEDNPGFLHMNAFLKDALVRRLGYLKWWYEPRHRLRGTSMSDLTDEELQYLASEGVDFEVTGESMAERLVPQPDGTEAPQQVPVYSVDIMRPDTDSRGCFKFAALPPEEVVWTPEARSFGDAPCVAHRRLVPVDELIRMGIDPDFIEEHRDEIGSTTSTRGTDSLSWSRQVYGKEVWTENRESLAPSQEKVLFTEAYVLVDSQTRPGESELRMFQCIGSSYQIANPGGDLVDEIPIAVGSPDPEPHTVIGLGNFDYLREVQRVKTQIQRGQLNSLAQSIENQMVVATSQVNLRDMVAPEISGLIRVRSDVQAVREIKHTFIGPDTLPVLQYYDQIRADRTGRAGPREGLDANVLQSTTQEAVDNTLSKQQQRLRMVARALAETAIKDLFRGMYRLIIKHQKHEMFVRIAGSWQTVNPKYWEAEADIRVNVALGTGSKAQRLAELQVLYADQRQQLMEGSPLVTWVEVRATAGKILDLMGYRDTTQFFKQWGPEQQAQLDQQLAEAAKDPANVDPQKQVANATEAEVQLDAANKMEQNRLKELEITLRDQRERDQMRMEHEYNMAKLEIERMKAAKPTTTGK